MGINPPNKSHTLIEATLRIRAYTSNFFLINKGYTPNKGHAFEPNLLCPNSGHTQIKATLWFFLILNTGARNYFFWESTENRTNGKRHGDSDTWVISDNGSEICHALLYVRLLWLKPLWQLLGMWTWVDFGTFVAQSGLVLICLVAMQMGVHLVVWSPVGQNLGRAVPPP